jgi:hypothetical protein
MALRRRSRGEGGRRPTMFPSQPDIEPGSSGGGGPQIPSPRARLADPSCPAPPVGPCGEDVQASQAPLDRLSSGRRGTPRLPWWIRQDVVVDKGDRLTSTGDPGSSGCWRASRNIYDSTRERGRVVPGARVNWFDQARRVPARPGSLPGRHLDCHPSRRRVSGHSNPPTQLVELGCRDPRR